MSSFAEKMLAKKRAAEEAKALESAVQVANTETQVTVGTPEQEADKQATLTAPNVVAGTDVAQAAERIVKVTQKMLTQAEAEAIAKGEVPQTDASGKPLSGFALIQARKNRIKELMAQPYIIQEEEHEQQDGNSGQVGTESSGSQQSGTDASGNDAHAEVATVSQSKELVQTNGTAEEAEESEEYRSASVETRQAYADIKIRIDKLSSSMGDDIKDEMQNLKRALMQNPNAVSLMLPSDIGEMVKALRKMTGVELAKADEKKTGKAKKVKEVALTAEQLEDAWKEL